MLSRSSALRLQVESALAQRVPAALTIREKSAPLVFPTGITALDELTGLGGLPRSALTEICGPASSGRTSVLLSLLAQATARQEACALIDASDAFHPESAQAAGVDLARLLWVRCGLAAEKLSPQSTQRTQRNKKEEEQERAPRRRQEHPEEHWETIGAKYWETVGEQYSGTIGEQYSRTVGEKIDGKRLESGERLVAMTAMTDERRTRPNPRNKEFDRLEQALKATDLLLQSGGFGLLVVDLADIAPNVARRIPLTSWFRFRRVVEETPTALVVLEQEPFARTCAALVLQLRQKQVKWTSLLAPEFYAPAVTHCAAAPAHTRLLSGLELEVEVTRSRAGAMRKPAGPPVQLATRTAWAG